MALTVEDGTGVANADSYVSLQDFRDYAAARGVSLPAEDAAAEQKLRAAMDYLAMYDRRLIGNKVAPDQDLSWPRVSGQTPALWWEGSVPGVFRRAQMVLAIHALKGPLTAAERPEDKGAVKAVTVGPIKTEYSEKKSSGQPSFPEVDTVLSGFFKTGGVAITAVRG